MANDPLWNILITVLNRTAQGLELGKLKDVHEIYKEVLHDVTGVDEAMNRLSKVMDSGDKYNKWLRVLGFGFAAATVAPFGFDGRIIDMPMCFILGCIVGYLQLVAAPASPIYNNVFEVGATIITSFIARGLGSIGGENPLFCFSAMAQSSIALILPGWFVCKFEMAPYRLSEHVKLTVFVSVRGPRASIKSYRPWVYPHGLCHYLLPLPRFRYNRRHCPVRPSRPKRHHGNNVCQSDTIVLPFLLRPALYCLLGFCKPSKVEADASSDYHCFCWLCRQLLYQQTD